MIVQQWRSQNAEKVTHIKGRIMDQALILFSCVPFHNGNFSERKEFFSFRAALWGVENYFNHIGFFLFYYARA